METTITASEFKAKCLHLMDEVATTGHAITITKRGKPIARLFPPAYPAFQRKDFIFGCMKGEIEILGDIISPVADQHAWDKIGDDWEKYYK